MGFRLQSALAGAAKSLSSRLKALEEETNELVKTEAGRVAQELKENRKARTAAKLDYGKAARKLQNYGLSDGQIEAVLAGGVEGATQFEQSLQSKEMSAALEGKQFNQEVETVSPVKEAMMMATQKYDLVEEWTKKALRYLDKISDDVILRRIKNLISVTPDVFDITDPPIIVLTKKYKLRLFPCSNNVRPELAKLLSILIIKLNAE